MAAFTSVPVDPSLGLGSVVGLGPHASPDLDVAQFVSLGGFLGWLNLHGPSNAEQCPVEAIKAAGCTFASVHVEVREQANVCM